MNIYEAWKSATEVAFEGIPNYRFFGVIVDTLYVGKQEKEKEEK